MDSFTKIALSPYGQLFYNEWKLNSQQSKYNVIFDQELFGEMDIARLKQAFKRLVKDYLVLHSSVGEKEGDYYWAEHQDVEFEIDYFDRPQSQAILLSYVRQPFNIENDLLLRVALVKLSEQHFRLILVMHHLIIDGAKVEEFIDNVSNYYNDENFHIDVSLKQQREILEKLAAELKEQLKKNADKHQKFWAEKLHDAPGVDLDFLKPFSSGAVQLNVDQESFIGEIDFSFDGEILHKLEHLKNKYDLTPYLFSQAVLAVLFFRYSGQSKLVISYPVAIKAGKEFLCGAHINSCITTYTFTYDMPIGEVLENAKEYVAELTAGRHQYFLAQDLIPCAGHTNILDISFNQTHLRDKKTRFTGISKVKINTNLYVDLIGELLFEQQVQKDRLHFRVRFNKQKTDEKLFQCFLDNYQKIFKLALEDLLRGNVETPISEYVLLTSEEYQLIVKDWNETNRDYPSHKTIQQLFEEQVLKSPSDIALIYEDIKLTYVELNKLANRLAHYLINQCQVKPDNLVALCLDRNELILVAILAVLKTGAAYVPIEPGYPDDRIAFIVKDIQSKVVLTNEIYQKKLTDLVDCSHIVALNGENLFSNVIETFDANPGLATPPTNLACVIYTSGTTGSPKGVMLEHRGVINRLNWGWIAYPYNQYDVCCFKTSISFVDHIAEVLAPMLKGIPLVVFGNAVLPKSFDLEDFIGKLYWHKVTRLVLVPPLLELILNSPSSQKLKGINYFFSSGDKLTKEILKKFAEKLPGALLVNIYGSSEVTADATYAEVEGVDRRIKNFFSEGLRQVNTVYHECLDEGFFTAPNVSVSQVCEAFNSSEIPDFPKAFNYYQEEIIKAKVIPYSINCSSEKFIGHMVSVLPGFTYEINNLIGLLNQNVVKIETAKSITFIEREAIGMLHKAFYKLPNSVYSAYAKNPMVSFGVIVSGGSIANLTALWVARNKSLGATKDFAGIDVEGVQKALAYYGYQESLILVSPLAHYSFKKIASLLGIGKANVISLAVDDNYRVDLIALRKKILACKENNIHILALIGVAGATETGTIDPLPAMADIAQDFDIPFHVDAAFGGSFVLSDQYAPLLIGIERADSITVCGHKQLYLPMGVSVCLFKSQKDLTAIHTTAAYQAMEGGFDYGKASPEGSKPAVSLMLHANLHVLGKAGYSEIIKECMQNTLYLTNLIKSMDCFELITEPTINIVAYRYIPEQYKAACLFEESVNQEINLINTQIQQTQFAAGKSFVSKTTIFSKKYNTDIVMFRVILCNPLTRKEHINQMLQDQLDIAVKICNAKSIRLSELLSELCIDNYDDKVIGKPMFNVKAYVLDSHLRILPWGAIGELYIGGAGLARGYLNKKELTKERFISNPFQLWGEEMRGVDERLYRTGDLVRRRFDGNLEYVGRNDFQVKIRGYRVELGEVESNLIGYSAIDQAVVIQRTFGENGAAQDYLIAYYVSKDAIDESLLQDYLAERLPEYMLPTVFVHLKELPVTMTGKIDRKALPSPVLASSYTYVPPSSEKEQIVCDAFARVLNLERVGATDNFFKIGGNSIKAITLVSNLQAGFKINVADIFNLKTPQKIAEKMKFGDDNLGKRLERIKSIYQMRLKEEEFQRSQNKLNDYRRAIQSLPLKIQKKPIKNVLLTGATGFLGSNLLYQLLISSTYNVYLLVRATSNEEAFARVNKKFQFYFDRSLEGFKGSRVFVLAADIEQIDLGLGFANYEMLKSKIDSVIHAAALTKHYGEYNKFYVANVQATKNLLDFVELTQLKDFHYISTASVLSYGQAHKREQQVFTEEDSVENLGEQSNVYIRTKYEGERVVVAYRQRGVNANIYRVGNLAFISTNSQVQENVEDNGFISRLKCLLNLKVIAMEIAIEEVSLVDYTAKAIVKLFDQQYLENEVFHILNPNLWNMVEFFAQEKTLEMKVLPIEEFIDTVAKHLDQASDQKLVERFLLHQGWLEEGREFLTNNRILQERTYAILRQLNFAWPVVSHKMFKDFIEKVYSSEKG